MKSGPLHHIEEHYKTVLHEMKVLKQYMKGNFNWSYKCALLNEYRNLEKERDLYLQIFYC